MKKGFTIMELIATIVIIAIIGGIGILAYNNIFESASDNYYKTVENSILLSGTEYFEKNREELPIKGYNIVALENLEEGNYISPVKDKKGNECERGDVYIVRDSTSNQYEYEVCLKCLDYESNGKFCRGFVPGSINVDAYLENSNPKVRYNPLLSYKNVVATDENVIIDLYVDKEEISYYKIDKVNNHCVADEQKKCEVTITESGSYLVSAYDKDGNKIADDRVINVKIDKDAPTFEIKNENRYTIEDDKDNRNVSIKLEDVKDDIGVKEIKYCIKPIGVTCNETDYKILEGTYTINEMLKSGSYHIDIVVSDMVGHETKKSSEFEVSYYAILKYDDGKEEKYEVVTGKKYGYLNLLPNIYNKKLIKWMYNGNNITNETVVTETKRHVLISEHTDKINIVTNTYCMDITYNGQSQKITKDAPYGVTFYDNVRTNAGSYTVKAKILYGLSWSDGTTADKQFTCQIKKKDITVTASNQSKIYDTKALNADTTCTQVGMVSGQSIACTSTGSITNAGTATKTLSGVVIKSGSTDVTSNYNVTKKNGTLTVTKASNPISVTASQSWSPAFSTAAQTKGITAATGGQGTVSYAINSQPSGNYFSISGTTVTMKANTPVGTYKVVIRATAAGNSNYNSGSKDITLTVTVVKASNPISVTASQSWSTTYSTSAQTKGITAATGGQGTVSYAINSQPSGNYFSISGTTVTMKAGTPAGTYKVVIRATAAGNSNYNSGYKDITLTVTVARAAGSFSCSDKTYSGGNQGACSCSGGTLSGTTSATNAGNYTAYCTPDGNHTIDGGTGRASRSWTMGRAGGSFSCSTKTFNGGNQSACSCTGGTMSGTTSSTNAGTYTAYCTPDGNHTIDGGTGVASRSWTMNKIDPSFVLTESTRSGDRALTVGLNDSVGAYAYTMDGTLDWWSYNSNMVGIGIDGANITKNVQKIVYLYPYAAGTTTVSVTYTPSDTTNYNKITRTVAITVNKGTASAPTLSDTNANKNGNLQCIGESGGTAGLTTEYRWRSVGGTWSAWSSDRASMACKSTEGTWEIQARKAGNDNYNTSAESNVATLKIASACRYHHPTVCADSPGEGECYQQNCASVGENYKWTCRVCYCNECE